MTSPTQLAEALELLRDELDLNEEPDWTSDRSQQIREIIALLRTLPASQPSGDRALAERAFDKGWAAHIYMNERQMRNDPPISYKERRNRALIALGIPLTDGEKEG